MNSDIVILSDRIKELSHTKGQGAFVLDGELAGFSPFGDFYQYGDVVYYASTDGTNYEVGSGEYRQNGSNNELTRFPLRSSALDSGPYYLNGDSASGPTEGKQGYFYPLYLTKSAAAAVAGATSVHTHTFSGYHGVTFYMPNNHNGHAESAGISGVDYVASGQPFDFPDFGIKEVYVTYPGKYSVFTGYGISGYREPKMSGVAFWGSEQLLNYDGDMMWSDERANLGISNTNPQFAIDVGGDRAYSQVRASGFFGGGSGVFFSGGQPLPQDNTKTASGGRQLEPFFRNELDGTTGTDAIFFLSGVVNEKLCSLTQDKGTVYAGPVSGCDAVGCSPDYPTFRYLTLEDIPDLSSLYVVQDTEMDEDPATLTQNGAVALYKESGVITYDDAFVFKKTNHRVGIGTNSPSFSLDVAASEGVGISGDVIISGDVYTAYNGNIHSSGGLFARTNSYFGNDVTVSGNLFVKGTTTYNDSTNVTIQDKQLELASTSGNDSSANADHLVDDGGLVVRSSGTGTVDTGDKKWTWKNSSNTWSATTSNNEKLGITTSGLIFNDNSVVSGAYVGGSGLTLDDGRVFQIGNMFKVGAVGSGSISSDGSYVTNFVHQADELGFSGVQGLSVYSSGSSNALEITFDASGLSGVLEYAINNSAVGYSGWAVHIPPQELHHPSGSGIDAIASNELFTISGVSGIATLYQPGSNNLILSPDALSGVLTRENVASGMKVSGAVVLNENLINASGDVLSVRTSGQIALSGNFLRDQIYASGNHMSGVFDYRLSNLTVSNFHADSVVTAAEGLTTNANDSLFPTASAVKVYVDSAGGGGGASYAGFRLRSDENVVGDTIGSAETVTISGISGVHTSYVAASNTVLIDAVVQSGNLVTDYTNMINASGMKVSEYALLVSGITEAHDQRIIEHSGIQVALSGDLFGKVSVDYHLNPTSIATSGETLDGNSSDSQLPTTKAVMRYVQEHVAVSGSAALSLNAASGLIKVGNELHMNVDSSGQLSQLSFGGSQDAGNRRPIRIGLGAGETLETFYSDLDLATNHQWGIFLGKHAGSGCSGVGSSTHNILIGSDAGSRSIAPIRANLIGDNAGQASSGIEYSEIFGYRAGQSASGITFSVGIGMDAGLVASGLEDMVFLGRQSMAYALDNQRATAIGTKAGHGSSGVQDSTFIGYQAGAGASGTRFANVFGYQAFQHSKSAGSGVNAFGYRAAYHHSGEYTTAVGYNAGAGSSGMYQSVMIGTNAGYAASGRHDSTSLRGSDEIYIGTRAGYKQFSKSQTISIGTDAGREANQNWTMISMGQMAGFQAQGGGYTLNLGSQAGAYQSGTLLAYNVNIGHQAGYRAEGGPHNLSIGHHAGSDRTPELGLSTVGNNDNIMIGQAAGYNGQGSYNILIGGYTGFSKNHKNCCFIIPGPPLAYQQGWVSQTAGAEDEYCIQLGGSIFGTATSTRLGKEPTSVSDFSSSTLQLAPDTSTRINLKTEMLTPSDTGDQIQASTDDLGHANTIVNSKGFLQIPIALNKTGTTSANINFYTHASDTSAKYLIPRVDGVVALRKGPAGIGWRLILFSAADNRWYNEGTGSDTPG